MFHTNVAVSFLDLKKEALEEKKNLCYSNSNFTEIKRVNSGCQQRRPMTSKQEPCSPCHQVMEVVPKVLRS